MRWNPTKASGIDTSLKSAVPVRGSGAPRRTQVAYKQNWDNTRAVTEALQRVTWVYRSVDAIASNAARLPIVLRQDNQWNGEIVEDPTLHKLLNSTPNLGEDSIAFRYRLSSQLLLSSKGVFVEVNRNRAGEVLSLVLLPPEHMTIIPDMKKFIAGYELNMEIIENGQKKQLSKKYRPEEVIWIRKPHPFNPYGALTPLESAGLAIETDWLAKMYNRNFMLNDGRPGGLVVVKGDMTEDDKEELRAKFGGSISRAGRISVIASEDGADFVDTAVTPRDAQYIDARRITKEEILIAFGVPESVVGNAAGRTFDNAEMERLIFWMETMVPHMDLVTRPLDALDPNPSTFTSYDLQYVDVLQRMEMKRREFILREADAGAISFNEYRVGTGKEEIDHPLADILWIPKTKMPVVTTDGEEPPPVAAMEAPAPSGRPPSSDVTEQPEQDPVQRENDPRQEPLDNTGTTPAAQLSHGSEIITKEDSGAEVSSDLWEQMTANAIDRIIERASRVVSEKSSGQKFRKAFFSESDLSEVVGSIFDDAVWTKQLYEDLIPIAKSAAGDDATIETIRYIDVVGMIEERVSYVVSEERSSPKPDMQNLPHKVAVAIMEISDDPDLADGVENFAKHYVNLTTTT